MDSYRDLVDRLGEETAEKVIAIWAAWNEGTITQAEAIAAISVVIAKANQKATTLADLALAAALTTATRTIVHPHGLTRPADDLTRLRKAASTLLARLPDTPDPQARAARLGRSEPLDAAQQARGDAIATTTFVEGWTRSVSGSACELCTWWAREGRIWPKTHPMPRHKGCTCTQTPVLTEQIRPVQR